LEICSIVKLSELYIQLSVSLAQNFSNRPKVSEDCNFILWGQIN
jgi:hypothetical protein